MAMLQEEIRNFGFKGWLSILGTGNRSTAPDNLSWYEELTTLDGIIKPSQIWSDYTSIPPAPNLAAAVANAAAAPSIIEDLSANGDAIHLTPSPNNKAFFATTVYDDLSTRIGNWIMPQLIPRTDLGWEGFPSIGYMIKLWDGQPGAGGVEITTSIEGSGADPGWFMHFGSGAIVIASSFTSLTDPTDMWITGFRYIGATGGAGGSVVVGTPQRLGAEDIDGTTNAIDTDIELCQIAGGSYAKNVKVNICNRNNAVVAVRLAHVDGAIAAVSTEDYILYDVLLQPYETKIITIDGMIPTDSLLVRSDTVNITFSAFGEMLTSDDGTKRLGATTVVADTDTALYTATGNVSDISVLVCNQDNASTGSIRIAIIDGAVGSWAVEDNIIYEDLILESESKAYMIDFELINTYTIGVRSSNASVTFIAYGRE